MQTRHQHLQVLTIHKNPTSIAPSSQKILSNVTKRITGKEKENRKEKEKLEKEKKILINDSQNLEKMDKKPIGICPVCGKGHIIERDKIFVCTNSSCGFFIHKEIKNTTITPEIARQIITDGRSEVLHFTNASGNSFTARIELDGNAINIQFDNEFLNGKCPLCGGRVQITKNGYNCENRVKRDEMDERNGFKCSFHINKSLCNRRLTREEVERFLAGKIDILDGFCSSAGNEYSAFLEISEAGYVRTNSRISVCPKCGGTILVGTKGFNCSNFRLKHCHMKFPRKIGGHYLTINDVRQLCESEDHTSDPVKVTQANGTTILKRMTLDTDLETITI